jgi:hypothetical protein
MNEKCIKYGFQLLLLYSSMGRNFRHEFLFESELDSIPANFSYFGKYCAIEVRLQQQKTLYYCSVSISTLHGEWLVAGVKHATSPADAMQFPVE